MKKSRIHAPLALTALLGLTLTSVAHAKDGAYVETDLVVNRQTGTVPTLTDSDGITHVAKFFDATLVNPWGIAESGTSPFWIAQGGSGVSTLLNSAGATQPLVVSIPHPSNPLGDGGIPTGTVFNNLPVSKGAFKVAGVNRQGFPVTAPAVFMFATKEGTILGWNPEVNPAGFDPAKAGKYAIVMVDNTAKAAYTGLAIATDTDGVTRLYAANYRGGAVDVFDTRFQQVASTTAFADPFLPRGYAPFNVAAVPVNGTTRIFVTYAIQNPNRLFGQGHGIVNTFAPDGGGLTRFAQHGQLNAPWGIVMTPANFGELGGTLWVGNFGDGQINAYDATTGEFVGKVRSAAGDVLTIDGLWTIRFGNGGNGGSLSSLYFTAGPNAEQDGLFGRLDPK